MAMIRRQIDIHAPVEKVYNFIEDPYNLLSLIQDTVEVKNPKENSETSSSSWSGNMADLPISAELMNIEDVRNEQIVFKCRGGIESLWSFRFESREDVTSLHLDISYMLPAPCLGKKSEKVFLKRNEQDVDSSLQKLKERLE